MKLVYSALLMLGLVSSPAAAETCVSPQQGRDLIESGRVRPFPEAARSAGIEQDVLQDVQLCGSEGGYRYEVDLLKEGRRESTEFSAETPSDALTPAQSPRTEEQGGR